MNTFVVGLFLFFLLNLAVALPVIRALNQARESGTRGNDLLRVLLPYLALDGLLVIGFALWLLFG